MLSPEATLWIAFNLGGVGSWLWQWQKWKTPERRWRDFWPDLGIRHVMANFMLDQVFFAIWSLGVLDEPIDKLGHRVLSTKYLALLHGGDSCTVQAALAWGYAADRMLDEVVYLGIRRLREFFGRRRSRPRAPTPTAPTATTPMEGTA